MTDPSWTYELLRADAGGTWRVVNEGPLNWRPFSEPFSAASAAVAAFDDPVRDDEVLLLRLPHNGTIEAFQFEGGIGRRWSLPGVADTSGETDDDITQRGGRPGRPPTLVDVRDELGTVIWTNTRAA